MGARSGKMTPMLRLAGPALLLAACAGASAPPSSAHATPPPPSAHAAPPTVPPAAKPAPPETPSEKSVADCRGQATDLSCEIHSPEELESLPVPATTETLALVFLGGMLGDGTPVASEVKSLEKLPALPRLKSLSLTGDLEGVAGIERLTTLEQLSVTLSSAGDLTPITRLTGLRRLESAAPANLPPLGALAKLERLKLNGAADLQIARDNRLDSLEVVSDSPVSLEPIAGMKSLAELHLEGEGITSLRGLFALESLRQVSLVRTRVTELRALHGLPRLKLVTIDPPPPEAALRALRKALPHAKVNPK